MNKQYFKNPIYSLKMTKQLIKSYGLLLCLTILLLTGCISEFVPPEDMKDLEGLLVVEGIIMEEGTRITLSRTVKLDEDNLADFDQFEDINNAEIHIIDENQAIIAVATQDYSWGPYSVNERFSFVPGMKYALDIKTTDNKHYRSAFVVPLHTPEIDSISYQIKDDYRIDFLVSTHDPANQINCFMWEFEEAWEIRSKYFQFSKYDPTTKRFSIPQSLIGENTHYCWDSDYSKTILVASSEKYMDAVIKNHKIHQIKPGTTRYSYLYTILVRQYGLDRDAYLYFYHLQKNLDESSSLFAPQPSEIAGNIQCLSDPEEMVIGYIFASKVTTYRLYVPMDQLGLSKHEDTINCKWTENQPSDHATAFSWGLGLSSIYEVEGQYVEEYVDLRCLDCTLRGGIKDKPDYWPNDHR